MLPADVEDFSLLPPFVSLFLSSDYGQRKVNELVEKKKKHKNWKTTFNEFERTQFSCHYECLQRMFPASDALVK